MSQEAKILIVDDEIQVREIIKEYLEAIIECQVFDSGEGQDALDKIKADSFDLIILDLKMPGVSGLDIIKTVRKQKPPPDILVTTAWDSAQVADEVIKEGATDYIVKPVTLETLKLKVKNILEKKGKYLEKSRS